MSKRPQFTLAELPIPMVYATHRTIRDCNSEFATLFGYERTELLDTGFHLLYPKFANFVRTGQMWKANLTGGEVYYDERIMKRRDQTSFWCRVHGRSKIAPDPFAEAVYCFEPLARPVAKSGHQLTDRQLQIVTLVAQGKTNHTIADETGLSARTVESHRARIMRAIGVSNGAELIAWFQSSRISSQNQFDD